MARICILQGSLIRRQRGGCSIFQREIRNYLPMALAVLLGCGLAFGELGSRQRALSNRLDCVTYSGDVGGSVPPAKPPVSMINFQPLAPLRRLSKWKAS